MKIKIPNLFKNKILCYALLVIAVLNVIGYITSGAYECLIVFLLAYYGAEQYCKNMACSILIALFASNFLFGCGRVKESFVENMKGSKEHMEDGAKMLSKAAAEAFREAADAEAGVKKAEEEKEKCPEGQKRNAEGKCEAVKEVAEAKKDSAEAASEAASKAAAAAGLAGEEEEKKKETFRNIWF